MFMLAGRNSLLDRVEKAFSANKSDEIKFVINSIENKVQHYLLIKIFVSLLTAVIGGFIIFLGDIDFVIFFSLIIFMLNFIPNFGSIVATLFPLTIGVINHGFSLRILLVMIGLMLTQFIIGNILEPQITGKNLNLSPIVILISLIFWGWTWGIVGMILAVPLTSAMKIMFEHIEVLKPLSKIISAE
jgi:predicted PurR-regulated permease PerM